RAPWGKCAPVTQPFVHNRWFSICGALGLDGGINTAKVVEGSLNHERFISYLCVSVLPLTSPYPGLRSVLILDNTCIHHSQEIENLVRA
ncbi:hypothetical protein EDD18DRAFT_1092084, partial [Armillaria luteobubalina]